MEFIAWGILSFIVIRTMVVLANYFGRLFLPETKVVSQAKLSVLIPARDEVQNLPVLLNSILGSTHKDLEVWVCDDHSTDGTYELLEEWAKKDSRMHFFRGDYLKEGWTGKNFACHQLSLKATGDLFLFVDADVVLDEKALLKAVSYIKTNKLNLLSIFPQQILKSFSEKVSVPFMNWALLNLLPLKLVSSSKGTAFSAANGQFMLFDAKSYRENNWHEQVKNKNVEDIYIARLMKKKGQRVGVLLGRDDVYCRMYENYKGALNGFSRNVHEFFLGQRWLMVFFWAVMISGPIVVYVYLGWVTLLFFLILSIVNCLTVSKASHQGALVNLFFHPLQMLFFTHLVFINIRLKFKKKSEWKGRVIPV
jgi:chlorobactene glucosyltransferase